MRRLRQEFKWLGLFALMPLAVVLIVLDDRAVLPQTWRLILLAGVAIAICLLALRWVEQNPMLLECESSDTRVSYHALLVLNEGGVAEPVDRETQPAADCGWEARRNRPFAQLINAGGLSDLEKVS